MAQEQHALRCAHADSCGGCTYYDTPYADELREKEAKLRELLGEHAPFLDQLHPAPHTTGYRNKMELAFGDTGKDSPAPALGIRKKRSLYEVATTENCLFMPDDLKLIAAYTMGFFRESGEAVFHRKRHTGTLRHLVLRRGEFTGEILVVLSTTSGLRTGLEPFVQGLRELPTRGVIVGILHARHDGVADVIKTDDVQLLWGRDFYREVLFGQLTFRVGAFSFFQTNTAGAEVLYDVVRGFAAGGRGYGVVRKFAEGEFDGTALDLYCGTGTIAQVIAPCFARVVGIELIPEAVAAAKVNACENMIANCEFYTLDITKASAQKDDLIAHHLTEPPAVVVVDPPRNGLSPKALDKIVALGAERVVYVACKPASLVRDLPVFINGGYGVAGISAVDLFPRTPHVEVCALLHKKN
jgi:23S rRNA (uracil-5-)-methyltransferase RumA